MRLRAMLFAITLLALPVEVVVAKSEPWPAVYQPAFRGSLEHDGLLTSVKPFVTLVHRSGRRVEVSYQELVPRRSRTAPSALLTAGYGDPQRANRPVARAWLRKRFDVHNSRDPVLGIQIDWTDLTYRVADRRLIERHVVRTVTVRL